MLRKSFITLSTIICMIAAFCFYKLKAYEAPSLTIQDKRALYKDNGDFDILEYTVLIRNNSSIPIEYENKASAPRLFMFDEEGKPLGDGTGLTSCWTYNTDTLTGKQSIQTQRFHHKNEKHQLRLSYNPKSTWHGFAESYFGFDFTSQVTTEVQPTSN